VPDRVPWPLVAAFTEYPTVPFPEPLYPEVILIQEVLLFDVQAHPAPDETLIVPVAAFGYALGRAGVLAPLNDVALPIKTLDHSPVEKIIEALVLKFAHGF
jgi:hypothetical protein